MQVADDHVGAGTETGDSAGSADSVRDMTTSLTVALLTYNRAGSFLSEAIAGILRQTYKEFEFLILDNGSTDHTAELVLSIDDPRIRYVRNAVGSSADFNYACAVRVATGHRIIVTHDDDIMEPTMLAEQMSFMDAHPGVKFLGTNIRKIDAEGQEIEPNRQFSNQARIFAPGSYIEAFLDERLIMMPSTAMFERQLTPSIYFDEHYYKDKENEQLATKHEAIVPHAHIAGMGDIDLPVRINTENSVAFLDSPLLRYRIHPYQDNKEVEILQQPIYLYVGLQGHARNVRGRTIDLGLFECYLLKYQFQQVVCQNQKRALEPGTRLAVHRFYREALSGRRRSTNAIAAVIPIYIAGKLNEGLEKLPELRIPWRGRRKQPFPSDLTSAAQAYHRWALAIDAGRGLFTSLPPKSRVVLIGSVLVAALIIMDAARQGVVVVACLDSNVGRQNTTVLGIPIYSHAWLLDHDDFDLVILTSEREHEEAMKRVVNDAAGRDLPTVSWKDLAAAANPADGPLWLSSARVLTPSRDR